MCGSSSGRKQPGQQHERRGEPVAWQERGHDSVGAGNAIAIQNLWENSLMLVMVGLYTLAAHAGLPVRATAVVFGGGLAVAMAGLWWSRKRISGGWR